MQKDNEAGMRLITAQLHNVVTLSRKISEAATGLHPIAVSPQALSLKIAH